MIMEGLKIDNADTFFYAWTTFGLTTLARKGSI